MEWFTTHAPPLLFPPSRGSAVQGKASKGEAVYITARRGIENCKLKIEKELRALFQFSISHFQFRRGSGFGGAGRDRTDDPLLAKQVLSQLSYSPRVVQLGGGSGWIRTIDPRLIKTVL